MSIMSINKAAKSLRDYQHEDMLAGTEHLKKSGNFRLCYFVGLGKTLTSLATAEDFMPGSKTVLVLVHSNMLKKQFASEVKILQQDGYFIGEEPKTLQGTCQVDTYQSYKNKTGPAPDVLILDEVHIRLEIQHVLKVEDWKYLPAKFMS